MCTQALNTKSLGFMRQEISAHPRVVDVELEAYMRGTQDINDAPMTVPNAWTAHAHRVVQKE